MSSFAVTVVAWLLDFGLLASLVLAAACGFRWCFREPSQRVALVWGTWLGLIALALAIALPQWPRFALLPSPAESPALELQMETELEIATRTPADVPAPGALPSSAALLQQAPAATSASWRDALAVAWLGTALLALGWIALGMTQTWRLVRRSAKAPPWIACELSRIVGKQRPPQVRTSQQLTSAVVVGAIAPRILLPEAAADESRRSQVRAALAHEWAHISRGDLWLLALERLLLPLLAWQPLFWWLRRTVRLDLELLADATAAGDEPVEYAEALVAWAKTDQRAPVGLAALSLWESPHTLSRRVTMLLDPKRTNPPAAHRGWQLLLTAVALALIVGLSLVTLRPHSADGHESQPPAEPDANARRSPDEPNTLITLQLCILETDRQELEAVLPVERRWHPDPETDMSLLEPNDWKSRLKTLASKPGTRILSRPQIQTLNGRMAYISIGSLAPPVVPAEGSLEGSPVSKPRALGLTVQLTPRQKKADSERQIEIEFLAAQADLKDAEAAGQPPAVVERKLSGKATVPVERQTLIIANRPRNPDLRPLVLAIAAFVVQRPAETEQEAQPLPRTGDLQHQVRQLQRQLEERTREAQAQRDQSAALREQIAALTRKLETLAASAPVATNTVIRLQNANATDVSKALRILLDEVKLLGGDEQVESIQFEVDEKTNSLIVSAQSKHWDAIKTIVARLDRPSVGRPPSGMLGAPGLPSKTSQNVGQTSPAEPAESAQAAARAAQLAERETQLQLLKLDLQEAEIGLRAAKNDMDRVQSLRERGVISQEEVAKHEFQLQSAEIKVMRAKIMLEGMMRQMTSPQPKPQANPKPLPSAEPASASRR